MNKTFLFGVWTIGGLGFGFCLSLEEEFNKALSDPVSWSKQKNRLNQALKAHKIDLNKLKVDDRKFNEFDFSKKYFYSY